MGHEICSVQVKKESAESSKLSFPLVKNLEKPAGGVLWCPVFMDQQPNSFLDVFMKMVRYFLRNIVRKLRLFSMSSTANDFHASIVSLVTLGKLLVGKNVFYGLLATGSYL
jgi:hypothetical protein